MTSWILLRLSRLADWLMVLFFVAALVFICQFLVNFYNKTGKSDEE